MEYCRSALRIALGLAQRQLPIFATLAGNDVLRYDYVVPFHRRLRLTRNNRFHKLAQLVRSNNFGNVANISHAIFGSLEPAFVNLVQESISTYDIHYEMANETDLLTQKSGFETSFYTFLNGLPYNLTLIYFDLRRKDFLSYYDIVVPIIKRQIGFVRQHKNDENYRQIVTMKVDHNQLYKEFNIAPEYPTIKLPSLLDITFDTKNESLNALRFDILTWLIFGCDMTWKIKDIAANYMVVVTALKFLLSVSIVHLIIVINLVFIDGQTIAFIFR